MQAYSMDLRVRVVRAYLAQEGSQAQLAERFQVSERWLHGLLRRRRDTGSIEPLPHGGGRHRLVGPDEEVLLLQALAETPDASLDELRQRCGVNGSRMGIARALQRLDITRTKSRSCAPNNEIPRSGGNAGRGNGRSGTSTRSGSSSSTKPTPRPR
jgi:transposase